MLPLMSKGWLDQSGEEETRLSERKECEKEHRVEGSVLGVGCITYTLTQIPRHHDAEWENVKRG